MMMPAIVAILPSLKRVLAMMMMTGATSEQLLYIVLHCGQENEAGRYSIDSSCH